MYPSSFLFVDSVHENYQNFAFTLTSLLHEKYFFVVSSTCLEIKRERPGKPNNSKQLNILSPLFHEFSTNRQK